MNCEAGHSARILTKDEIEKLEADRNYVPEFKRNKLEKEAAKNWDKFYLRNETRFFKDRHWTTQEFTNLCPDIDFNIGLKILEVGCGVGNFLFPFIEDFPLTTAYACDFSPRAVQFVKDHAKYDPECCTAFVCDLTEDLLTESVPQCSVDTLRPGGSVIFRDYGLYDHAMLRFQKGHKLQDNFYVRQDGTRAYYFSTENLNALFEESGFETVSCDYVIKETTNRKEGICVPRIFVQARFRNKIS